MNILIIGSGGREHAFALSASLSPLCTQLYIAPGNAGTAKLGTNVHVSLNDFHSIRVVVLDNNIDLVICGPEDPLVAGLADFFLADDLLKHVPFVGPVKAGAVLEGSKDFAKAFMHRHSIPTAAYRSFTLPDLDQAYDFIDSMHVPVVLKADGPAAGKGVLISDDRDDAKKEVKAMLAGDKFGASGHKVVIEEFLKGIEVSVFVLCDGENYLILPEAKDYKRIGEGDHGLNTGGMGAISPVPFADAAFMQKVEDRIIKPTVNGLYKEGIIYKGFIFIGLMNVDGDPFVIEYNCRMGDPETEAVLPRIENDFVELMLAAAKGELKNCKLYVSNKTAATAVMVSGGYPGNYEKGFQIKGLDLEFDSMIFHAGTAMSNGHVVTNGGRVLAVTSLGNSIADAVSKTYSTLHAIHFDYGYYRKDIGRDLMNL